MNKEDLQKISIIVSLVLSMVLIVNTSLSTYVLYTSSFQASMGSSGETLEINLRADSGRVSPLRQIWRQARGWVSAFYVGGTERQNATTSIQVSVTGSNVGSSATVDYYIEARESTGQGSPYRFLEGNGSSVTIGGAALELSNQTNIENHLTAMGLDTTSSWTIDYYVYVKAETVGAVSGETLTSEITRQKFDTVTYEYGSEVTTTIRVGSSANDGYIITSQHSRYYSSSSLLIGDYSSTNYDYRMWARIAGFGIPQGTQINSATFYIRAKGDKSSPYPTLFFYAEDSDAAGVPSDELDYNSRPLTTEYGELNFTAFNENDWYSVDVTGAVQEVLDRPGWSQDNPIMIMGMDSGGYNGADRDLFFYSYDYGTVYTRPKLSITYISYTASWYPLTRLTLASLPVTLDAVALGAMIAATVFYIKNPGRKHVG